MLSKYEGLNPKTRSLLTFPVFILLKTNALH